MWKLLLDDKGAVVLRNGMPVYLDPQGKEVEFNIGTVMQSLTDLRLEAKTHREAKEAAESAYKPFKDAGLTDPAAAAKALQTVSNLDQSKLVEAGKVEEIRLNAVRVTEEKFAPVVAERDKYKASLYDERIGGRFARSPLIVGDKAKLAIPADIVQATFGKHFSMDDNGNVVAKDSNGNAIYSRANPGKTADFDEALEFIVEAYPHKDAILKGSGSSGFGAQNGNNGNSGGNAKQKTRAEFDAMPHSDRMAFSKAGGKLVD